VAALVGRVQRGGGGVNWIKNKILKKKLKIKPPTNFKLNDKKIRK
jgi:hypothetical protein